MRFKIYLLTIILLTSMGHFNFPVSAQTNEKSLDIERYSNEPLELIAVKIGEQSVKPISRINPGETMKG